jgi:DNA-binding FadR family transcriptional regulator
VPTIAVRTAVAGSRHHVTSRSRRAIVSDETPHSIVRAPKTAEIIYTRLRNSIVRGQLLPGDSLPPEPVLMNQFGVSRPTLREAFRLLEADQLIVIRRGAHGGATVTAPDATVAAQHVGLLLELRGTTVRDVYEARMLLEPFCARLLAAGRTAADLAELRSCIDALDACTAAELETEEGSTRWSDITSRFHTAITDRCGNQTMALQAAVLQDIVATHIRLSTSRTRFEPRRPATFERTRRSYRKFADLVEAKDGARAEEHWRLHMTNAGKILLRDDFNSKRVVDLFS